MGPSGEAVEAVSQELDSAALLKSSQLTTEAWYKSKRTTRAYANYVKAGKAWLEKWVAEEVGQAQEGAEAEEAGGQASLGGDRAVFAGAFDQIGEHTPTVLRMYVAFKCEHEKRSFSTAEGIRSAFKGYFEM